MRTDEAPAVTSAPDRGNGRRQSLLWLAAALVTAAVILAVPLHWNRRYYFYGDTQIGAYGQWYHLGKQLLAGHWPLLNPSAWHGGNYVAEGQWGLFNPLVMAIGLLATTTSSPLIFCTLVKAFFAAIAVLGGFVLARSYGLRPPAAYVVGTTILLGGMTQYMDLTTWVTSLLVWAMVPWAWWALRRTMIHGANPLAALAINYLLVTVGYVYGTIYLILVLVACLVDAAIARNRAGFVKVFLIGVAAGLVAITVYLPGVLTAPVTVRDSFEILNDTSLPVQVTSYLTSMIPLNVIPASVTAHGFPLGYIGWFLPALLWVDLRRVKAVLRPLWGAIVLTVLMVLWTLGPSVIGPLRYPARLLPVSALLIILLATIIATKAVTVPPRSRLVVSLVVTVIGGYLVVTRALFIAPEVAVATALVCVGIVILWLLWRAAATRTGRASRVLAASMALFIVAWGIGLQVFQHERFPNPNSTNRHMPAHLEDYKTALQDSRGDVMTIGDYGPYTLATPTVAKDLLIGESWYVSDKPVISTYTTISFRTFYLRYCMPKGGVTCPGALKTLFAVEPTTGRPRVDLLSVSTLLIYLPKVPSAATQTPPAGWHVAKKNDVVVMWVRDTPLPTAGGVVATSDGTSVTTQRVDARTVTLKVDTVGPSGGTVTFSRLDWPGYTVSGGTLASPVEDYLVRVAVPADSAGSVVRLHYDPPGWRLGVAAIWTSALLSLVMTGLAFVLARRRRTSPPAPEDLVDKDLRTTSVSTRSSVT